MQRSAWEYHAIARDALRGRWDTAVPAGFIAGLLGAGTIGGSNFSVRISGNDLQTAQQIWQSDLWLQLRPVFVTFGTALGILSLVQFLLGGAITLGYVRFNLKLIEREDAQVDDLFSQFHRFGQGFLLAFLRGLYVFLWSLLLIVPGIVKGYSYAMAPYLLYEHEVLGPDGAISASKRIMYGNRWRLFCLELSFIGWSFLCAIPPAIGMTMMIHSNRSFLSVSGLTYAVGITLLLSAGYLLLYPYQQAAYAAFYRDLVQAHSPETAAEAQRSVEERFRPEEDQSGEDPWGEL